MGLIRTLKVMRERWDIITTKAKLYLKADFDQFLYITHLFYMTETTIQKKRTQIQCYNEINQGNVMAALFLFIYLKMAVLQ